MRHWKQWTILFCVFGAVLLNCAWKETTATLEAPVTEPKLKAPKKVQRLASPTEEAPIQTTDEPAPHWATPERLAELAREHDAHAIHCPIPEGYSVYNSPQYSKDFLMTSGGLLFGLVFDPKGEETLYRSPSNAIGPARIRLEWTPDANLGVAQCTMVPSFPVTVYVDVDEGFRWGSVSGCGDTAHIEKDGLYTLQVFSKQCELEGHAFYGLDYTEAHSGPLEMREGEVVWRAELFKPPLIVLEPDEREEKYDRWMETMDESLDRFEDSQLKHIAQLEYFIELAERLQQAAPEDSEDWTNLAKKRSTFERKIESISIETLDEEEESQTERLDWIEQRFGE